MAFAASRVAYTRFCRPLLTSVGTTASTSPKSVGLAKDNRLFKEHAAYVRHLPYRNPRAKPEAQDYQFPFPIRTQIVMDFRAQNAAQKLTR